MASVSKKDILRIIATFKTYKIPMDDALLITCQKLYDKKTKITERECNKLGDLFVKNLMKLDKLGQLKEFNVFFNSIVVDCKAIMKKKSKK